MRESPRRLSPLRSSLAKSLPLSSSWLSLLPPKVPVGLKKKLIDLSINTTSTIMRQRQSTQLLLTQPAFMLTEMKLQKSQAKLEEFTTTSQQLKRKLTKLPQLEISRTTIMKFTTKTLNWPQAMPKPTITLSTTETTIMNPSPKMTNPPSPTSRTSTTLHAQLINS